MTAPAEVDLVALTREFRTLLPYYANSGLHQTQRLAGLLYRAIQRGWTPATLARECGRDLAGVANAAAVVMWRLEQAADHDPPAKGASRARMPLCGECEDGWLVDPKTRLPVKRCDCRKATA